MTGLALIARSTLRPVRGRVVDVIEERDRDLPERKNLASSWPTYEPSYGLGGSGRLAPLEAGTLRNPGGSDVTVCHQPFVRHLRGRYTTDTLGCLRTVLREAGVDYPPTTANLVPAGGSIQPSESLGHGAGSWRDTALIGSALKDEPTAQLARSLAADVLSGGYRGHNQLDALGLGLFTIAVAAADEEGSFKHLGDLPKAAAMIAAHVGRIDIVNARCNGHWGEAGPKGEGAILTSSIGCVVHGLMALERWLAADEGRAGRLDDYLRSLNGACLGTDGHSRTLDDAGDLVFSFARGDHRQAIVRGQKFLQARFVGGEWFETFSDALGRRRKSDLSLSTLALLELSVPEAERILTRAQLIKLANQLERDLKGLMGYRRYAGDGWLAAYPGADSADSAARAKVGQQLAQRHAMIPDTSPEWSSGNAVMASVFARLFLETRDVRFRDKATEALNRLVGNITCDPKTGGLVLSELFWHVRDGNRFRYAGNGLELNRSGAYLRLAIETMADVIFKQR